jgi:hypothetical protein
VPALAVTSVVVLEQVGGGGASHVMFAHGSSLQASEAHPNSHVEVVVAYVQLPWSQVPIATAVASVIGSMQVGAGGESHADVHAGLASTPAVVASPAASRPSAPVPESAETRSWFACLKEPRSGPRSQEIVSRPRGNDPSYNALRHGHDQPR